MQNAGQWRAESDDMKSDDMKSDDVKSDDEEADGSLMPTNNRDCVLPRLDPRASGSGPLA